MLYLSTGKEGDCTKHGDFFSRFDFCNFNTVDSLHSTTFGGVHSFTIYSPFHLSRNKGEKSELFSWNDPLVIMVQVLGIFCRRETDRL